MLHALSARAWRDSARAEKVLSSPTPSRRSLRLDAELGDDAAGEDANSREPGARERGLDARAADMSDVVGRGARCAVCGQRRGRSRANGQKAVLAGWTGDR